MAVRQERAGVRKAHLDASIIPLKHALLSRAEVLDRQSRTIKDTNVLPAGDGRLYAQVAAEFRNLAEELHYW